MCDAAVDQVDIGSTAGIVEFFTVAFGTLLATLTFSDPAFGAASSGVATANAITGDASADNSGEVVVFRVSAQGTGAKVVWEGTAGEVAEDVVFNTKDWVAGDAVDITSWTNTMPAG
jgi:hypothetical protein